MGSHIRLLNARLGSCPLVDITYAQLQQVFSDLAKEQQPRSVKNIHGTLRNLLGQAKREGLIKEFPTPVLPKIRKTQQDWLTLDQMRTVIKGCADHRQKAFTATLAETGARIGEILALKVNDIKEQTLSINKSVYLGNCQDPKTSSAFRDIYVSNQLREMLRGCSSEGFFFKTRSGGPWWAHGM